MAFPIESPLPVFYDRNGSVLDAGYVYIGTVNLNPETSPIAVFWDAAGTQPAPQPLRTVRGYIARNGAPATVYVNSDFSVVVRDVNRQLVINATNSAEIDRIQSVIGRLSYASLADLRADGIPGIPAGQTRVVTVLAHTSGTGVGGGQFRWDPNSAVTDDNALFVNPTGNLGNGRWVRMYEGAPMVTYWGAVGDNVTNNLAAIQAAVNWVTGSGAVAAGRTLFFPEGLYRINGKINVPFSQGWTIQGAGKYSTQIVRTSTNTPHFEFLKENTHNWTVRDIGLTGLLQPATTDTLANGFYINHDTFTGSGIWGFNILNVYYENVYTLISNNTATATGWWQATIDMTQSGRGVVGGFVVNVPSAVQGCPNIVLGRNYYYGTNAARPYAIDFGRCESFNIQSFETNEATNQGILRCQSASFGTVGAIKTESLVVTGNLLSAFDIQDGNVEFGSINVGITTLNPGVGNRFFVFSLSGAAAKARVGTLMCGVINNLSGTVLINRGSDLNHTLSIGEMFGNITTGTPQPPVFFSDIGATSGADFARVETWQNTNISANNGTVSKTMVFGDETTQYFNSALAADVACLLPPITATNSGTTVANVVSGYQVTVIRGPSATGAFNLNIQTSAGVTLKSLTTANTFATYQWRRVTGWVLVRGGTIV